MKIVKRFWWIPLVLIAVAIAGFVIWAESVPAPMVEAIAALASDEVVSVSTDGWLVFQPESEPATGLIFYPGGRVDARAYAPLAREIAAGGYLVVIVPMPLNLAVFGADKASEVIARFPAVESWAIGGHSLGGAMAARYAYLQPEAVDGLVLWAAYPAGDNSLADSSLAVLSVFGTRDGLATIEKIDASRTLLPEGTIWLAIEGGNHAQFGWYGDQAGDNAATIDRTTQQTAIVEGTTELLQAISQ